MSTESRAVSKKRASPDGASCSPVPTGDHRKRRRNRTTQSCFNCHTSKRMCDRRRPCGRCIQLGLTGLCVYEVDDPDQRCNTQDESSRLRERVAELEGVIRELKNKPHPRWAKSRASFGEEFNGHGYMECKFPSESSVVASRQQINMCDPSTNADSNETSSENQTSGLVNETSRLDYLAHPFSSRAPGMLTPFSTSELFDIHSPLSDPSTSIATPEEEHPQMHFTVTDGRQLNGDTDLTSFFTSYPNLLVCDEHPTHIDPALHASAPGQRADPRSMGNHDTQFLGGHCGCLNEAASHNAVLELSLHLRKAADILSRSVRHRFPNGCPISQKIDDLDAFATATLGNIVTSPGEHGPVHLCSQVNAVSTGSVPPMLYANNLIPPIRMPALPPFLRECRSWMGLSYAADPFSSFDDSFITWEPSHQF